LQNAIVYQIFPDRFRDGDPTNNVISGTHFMYGNAQGGLTYPAWNSEVIDPRDPNSPFYQRWSEDFYGGDLPGVTEKLDYLQSMGVTALYLNPIFLSPSNHKYDTTSFEQVDPNLGGDEALAALLAAAKARGMAVILDGVFNHTSSDSVYFDKYSRYPGEGAYESQTSPYYDWYTFNAWPDDYESWWGYDTLPKLRSDNGAVRDYIWRSGADSIAARWVLSGTAGWRLDVGGDVDSGAPELGGGDYWEGFRQTVKGTDPQAAIIGEEWGDATRWLLGAEWDSVMNYRFRSALLSFLRDTPYTDNDNNASSSGGVLTPISVSRFDQWLRQIQEDYPPPAWYAMLNLVGSHDTNRVRFVLGHAQHADGTDLTPAELDARQGLMALLQFTLPGAPTIYYGDEVGVESPGRWYNDKWEDDPYNRVPFPWDDTPGHYQARAGVRTRYAQLAQLRNDHPALRTGSFDTLLTDDERQVYAYGRKLDDDVALVIVNRSTETQTVTLPLNGYLADGVELDDGLDGQHYTVTDGAVTVSVAGLWGRILLLQPEPSPSYHYLPLVLRGWSPLPWQPILDPIQGAEDGDYEVSWQELPSPQADTYTLQEAQDADFTVELREVCTTAQQSCAVSGQPPGTYYYRVRGQNAYGLGPWSETQTATVPGLRDLVTDVVLTLPQPLGDMDSSWCTWGWCSISPRLYHAPLPDDRTLIGWTDAGGDGHVSVVSADGRLTQTYDYAARSLRGLVAHDDGGFAVLLWDAGAKIMWLSRYDAAGSQVWTANIDGALTSFNPNIGDSRLAYGNGLYAAYFAVHGDSGWPAGHEGDQLTYVDNNGVVQSGGWEWGCSHSMAELVSYHPTLGKFAPVCSSDCYASKGILLNDNQVVYASDGNCGGLVSAQLGQIALSDNAWKLVFNALDRPGFVGRGIGLATVDGSFQSSYLWLTDTDGQYERDPVLARLGSSLQSDRYLVGWRTIDDDHYWLGVIDGGGNFIKGPEDVTAAGIAWGNRDDSFRTRADGSVSWVQGDPSSTTLHLFRFDGSGYVP
ncbi:MAG TPA: hypothetical protein ENJ31_06595, partial [Anaerolineae bacterium]|nr:hypothetical protein [Anaerolineae bacterium]